MKDKPNPVAEGFHSPFRRFCRLDRPDGKDMHAQLKIGNSFLMLGEECRPHDGHERDCVRSPADLKGTTKSLYLYVNDVDTTFELIVNLME